MESDTDVAPYKEEIIMRFNAVAKIPNEKEKRHFVENLNLHDIFPTIRGVKIHINIFGEVLSEIGYVLTEFDSLPNKDKNNEFSFTIVQ